MEPRKIIILLIVMFFAACGGGTEVLNPQDSIDTIIYTNAKYAFSLTLPIGWTMRELASQKICSAKVYADPKETAEALVLFERGETDLVVFGDSLRDGETSMSYAEVRHAIDDEFTSGSIGGNDSVTVRQRAPGENGGTVSVLYLKWNTYVLTFHLEVVAGSAEEASQIEQEFSGITGSVRTPQSSDGSSGGDGGGSSGGSSSSGDSCDLAYLASTGFYVTVVEFINYTDEVVIPLNGPDSEAYNNFVADLNSMTWCYVCNNATNKNGDMRSFATDGEEANFRDIELPAFIFDLINRYGLGSLSYTATRYVGDEITNAYNSQSCFL